jgi:hypothetical protein
MSVDEVSALKLELEKSQEKLAEWKVKAKRGVDQLREQLMETSDQLTRVKGERDSFRMRLAQLEEISTGTPIPIGLANSTTLPSIEQVYAACSASVDAMFTSFALRGDAFVHAVQTISHEQSVGSASQQQSLQELQAAYDKYRRRAEQSIKLSSKQQETLVAENKDLQKELDNALQELNESHRHAAEVKESLEKQLDTALYAIDTLRSEQADRNRQDQQRAADESDRKWISVDEAKAEIELVHSHFVEREEELRQRHIEEIQRLHHSHDEAIRMLEDELSATQDGAPLLSSSSKPNDGCTTGQYASDEAYSSLLKERDALKATVRDRDARIQQLESHHDKNTNTVVQDRLSPTSTSAFSPTSIASAKQRIVDLEQQVSALSEQLWAANNVILENKAKRSTDKSGKSSEGQQSSYLKSIVVKLLCEKTDTVRSNLVPVLATLLFLEPEDLRSIYTANPTWR